MNLTKPQRLIYDMEKYAGGSISVICGSMLCRGTQEVGALAAAVNTLYQINDALRIRIREADGVPEQTVAPYHEKQIDVLYFKTTAEMDDYAEKYATEPLNMFSDLCEIKIILLPEQYGILAKLHHIIGDAWTLSLLGKQFIKLINGETPEAYSYIDYVDGESTYCQSKRYEKDRAFFVEQFRKCDEVTYLSEKQSSSFEARRKTFVISKDQTKQILEYAQKKGVSAFVLLTAVLATYINRTKMNAERFYIGTAVLNRSGSKEQNTAGMFINTVPLLMELDNRKDFSENLICVADTAFSALRHQRYHYGDVLNDLRAQFGLSDKLYDVMISYQNAAVGGGSTTAWYHCGMQTESLQIHIDDRDDEGILKIHYDYLNDKFSEAEIENLHEHLCNLLFDAIENDEQKLYELNLLSDSERETLQYKFNDTKTDYPRNKSVHQLFEEQASLIPNKTAVIASDATLTYRKLNEEANRIAHSLIERGIQKGDIVAVILPRTSHLIPALFGVLKSGATYLPIDPEYPQERIDYLLSESEAKYIIDEKSVVSLLQSQNTENPQVKIDFTDYFCALHTSGSTGRPKLTVLKQSNLINFLYGNLDFWNGVDTVISVTIVTFDIFMQDTLLSLALGKKLILASNEQIFNQSEFEKMFELEQNVMFFATPTKLMSYIKGSKSADFLHKIRSLIVGGEVFTDELYELIVKKLGKNNCRNIYGPTEATICASESTPPPHTQSRV